MELKSNLHIKMEDRPDGSSVWLETESTGEKTIIFENVYDAQGTCKSEEVVGWCYGELESEEDVKEWASKKALKAVYETLGNTEYAETLWSHRDDKYGLDVETESGLWNICKGCWLIELDSQSLPKEDVYPYDEDGYYLSKNSQIVYKVSSLEDVCKVLNDEGEQFFEFC